MAKTLAEAQFVIASDLALIECDRVLIRVVVLDELQDRMPHRQARLNAVSACWTLLTLDEAIACCPPRLVIEPYNPPFYGNYDIHPDGKPLVLVLPAGELRGREIGVLLNWPAEITRLQAQ